MRSLLLLLTILIVIKGNSQTRKLTAETNIQQVTIFSSGARVQRTSTVNLPAGRMEISFEALSNQLDQQTVQLKADASITLLSVQSAKDYLSERKIDSEERSFIDRISLLKEKSDLDARLMDVFKNEEAMLIKNQSIGGENGVQTAELKQALDLQRQRLTEVYGKQLEIQKRIESERLDMVKLRAQLMEISKKKDSVSYIVTALVDCKETRTVNFQLMYNVKDAGWYPTYDVRVTDVSSPLLVLMHANVFQRSGETWKNVSLQLSTGNPNENATPSILQPWRLGFYDPSITTRATLQGSVSGRVTDETGQPVAGATVSMRSYASATITDVNGFFKLSGVQAAGHLLISAVGFNNREVPMQAGYFTIALERSVHSLDEVVVVGYGASEDLQGSVAGLQMNKQKKAETIQTVSYVTQIQPTAMIYAIDEKYSVETDGKTTTIGIRQFDIPAIYDYYSTPKTDPSAFLTARIVNWSDYNLQSGEVSLYYEGTYLGKTYIDLGSASDTLSLSLGKDNGIKISRTLVKEYSRKKFIGNSRTETKEYEITVRNTKSVSVNLWVQDQVPVSVSKEINVDDIKAADATIDNETGIALWKLNLSPGQEKKLYISYSVKYPKDKTVILE